MESPRARALAGRSGVQPACQHHAWAETLPPVPAPLRWAMGDLREEREPAPRGQPGADLGLDCACLCHRAQARGRPTEAASSMGLLQVACLCGTDVYGPFSSFLCPGDLRKLF